MCFAHWVTAKEVPCFDRVCFIEDGPDLPEYLENLIVATASENESQIDALLARGAQRVLVGELALRDSTAVDRLLAQYGKQRIGLWVRATKGAISWSLAAETPNAGFKCMQPSMGTPGWDILTANGNSTGTDAEWWISQMVDKGIATVLVSIDMQDEDMNICATLMLNHGEVLWFSPLHQSDADLEPWVRWGKVRQLVLPQQPVRDAAEIARIAASVPRPVNEEPRSEDVGQPMDAAQG